uniref:Uncharacterized protein n=1 Tax=Rhizophora mucronata TaxID=61149 RepID=A0A2P2NSC8_RHIMU
MKGLDFLFFKAIFISLLLQKHYRHAKIATTFSNLQAHE